MARTPKHGLGSYDREYEYVLHRLEELRALDHRAKAALSRTYDALESGSASRLFKAKSSNQDVLSRLSEAMRTAHTAENASGRKLDQLPKHAPFDKAHSLMREFRDTIDYSERLRKKLIRVSYGEASEIRTGLESAHDRTRRRRRRHRW